MKTNFDVYMIQSVQKKLLNFEAKFLVHFLMSYSIRLLFWQRIITLKKALRHFSSNEVS